MRRFLTTMGRGRVAPPAAAALKGRLRLMRQRRRLEEARQDLYREFQETVWPELTPAARLAVLLGPKGDLLVGVDDPSAPSRSTTPRPRC